MNQKEMIILLSRPIKGIMRKISQIITKRDIKMVERKKIPKNRGIKQIKSN